MQQVFRCFVEKRPGHATEAARLYEDLRRYLGIDSLTGVRIWNRYDVEGITPAAYRAARDTVFSEPQVDLFYDESLPLVEGAHRMLAVESLPGQYDQRADSCAQCVALLTGGDRPTVAAAKVYALLGAVSDAQLEQVRSYLVNPVECREASSDKPATLAADYPEPAPVAVLDGFCALDKDGLDALRAAYSLAMDGEDLAFLQAYFRDEEGRDPTVTELRVVDTYWSDHCRHTTFATHIDDVQIDDPAVRAAYESYLAAREEVYGDRAKTRPVTLMDIATMGMKTLKKRGLLPDLDESEEVNACSVRVTAMVDGEAQPWLLMFKNETHNHPTEIEPFGGAATCIGGAIRDPLSGRAYVYQAMRVTGCGDPTAPLSETLPGKLPQRKLARTATAGNSSYGDQIGLATGHVAEIYHPGYTAKHMEVGAVVGAAPAAHVVREQPAPGDKIILLGGRTGRDGIGGATGSSKTHDAQSLNACAAEVQKGNAPEERKIQRLFRNGEVTRLIKRCNDFGAGGVAVAIGELADGLAVNLDAVRKKYDGLDGTELAISESQERMAVVVAPGDAAQFIAYAEAENLEAYVVAEVTENPRLTMRWKGTEIVSLSRAFLNTNGADKHAAVSVPVRPAPVGRLPDGDARARLHAIARDLTMASQRGISEYFDSTIGSGTLLMPFGGKTQRTPSQAMAALLPVPPESDTPDCSVMAYGFDPYFAEQNPFAGASSAVVDSLAKLVAAGCDPKAAYLSLQEYFERLRGEPTRWGKPFAALLGAFSAQLGLGVAAIGGKDSMSGSFLDMDVPPTLISFAVATAKAGDVLSTEFKEAGNPVYLFRAPDGDYAGIKAVWETVHRLSKSGKIRAAWAVGAGGVAEGVMKMSFGNEIGFRAGSLDAETLFAPLYGSIIAECTGEVEGAQRIGCTTAAPTLEFADVTIPIETICAIWEDTLEGVYPTKTSVPESTPEVETATPMCSTSAPAIKTAKPRAVIPVFPGTNCEYDTARACLRAGIEPEILVVRNLTAAALAESAAALERAISRAQMIILPGGFSGGDEPDGSGKFIAAFFRNPRLTDAVHDLLRHRDGLMLGICNGFQALIKLGLVPYGEIREMDETCPTLTYNLIGRHQSRYVSTRVTSVNSPWMSDCRIGDIHAVPVSHGEGRFVASPEVLERLLQGGQIATRYVDASGAVSMDTSVNPNGSMGGVEGLFSPDGRVFGKMAHSERCGAHIAKNISGEKHQPIFEAGARYFK